MLSTKTKKAYLVTVSPDSGGTIIEVDRSDEWLEQAQHVLGTHALGQPVEVHLYEKFLEFTKQLCDKTHYSYLLALKVPVVQDVILIIK